MATFRSGGQVKSLLGVAQGGRGRKEVAYEVVRISQVRISGDPPVYIYILFIYLFFFFSEEANKQKSTHIRYLQQCLSWATS